MSEPSTTSQLYVGTSGWAYTIWKPEFYPNNVASKNFLKYYATQLNTVEVNYTFRRSLTEKAATDWVADVGPEFPLRLESQSIHHSHSQAAELRGADSALSCDSTTAGRAARSGAVPAAANQKADVSVLRDFLALLPRNFKTAFEFRHASWFSEEVYQALRRSQCHSLPRGNREADHARDVRTANYIYFRFRQPSYSTEEVAKLAERVRRCVADGLETYAFFKHEEDPRSPFNAVELLKTVRQQLAANGNSRPLMFRLPLGSCVFGLVKDVRLRLSRYAVCSQETGRKGFARGQPRYESLSAN